MAGMESYMASRWNLSLISSFGVPKKNGGGPFKAHRGSMPGDRWRIARMNHRGDGGPGCLIDIFKWKLL
jgi:hypothetical protein